MTFDVYERSLNQGEPVLLFDFFIGLSHWRYTTADRTITYLSNGYAPASISAGSINQGNEIKKKSLTVTVPLSADVVQRLQSFPPSGDFMLSIVTLHQTDPDLQGYTVFIGRVMSQSQAGGVVTLNCEPAYTGVKTTGLRRRWQLNCAHVLYGPGCTLLPSAFVTPASISGILGNVISCAGLVPPIGLAWAGGYIEWDSGLGYNERRSINSASASDLTIAYGSPDLTVGLLLNVYPGCDHTTAACIAFGNMKNYGGQPYIPSINPLSGNPIY